jgi:uroporphyrinogen decarboxylase
MTQRERILAVLNREQPDRVPMNYSATQEASDRLCAHLGCTLPEAFERLHVDTQAGVGPTYCGPRLPENTDIYGIRRRKVDYGTGVYWESENAPLAAFQTPEEVDANYTWPSPDWWDFSVIPGQVEAAAGHGVLGGASEPGLLYKALRGEQQAFMDFLANPEMILHCIGRIFDYCCEMTRRIFEQAPGRVDITVVAEDLGGQDSLMYSPEHIRAYFLPGMRRMADLARQNGSHVYTHTDGAVREVLPDLIGMGTQILNPVQWVCKGMDRAGLKRDFGDKLIFHGAMDNQHTLPFGTPADVRQEVLDNLATLGRGGGYIIAPCHNIQSITPPENIVAMYETGYAEGWT